MSVIFCRGLFKIIPNFLQKNVISVPTVGDRSLFLQSCLFRAKKSTRERKLKLLRKRKAQKAAAALRKPTVTFSRKKRKDKGSHTRPADDSSREPCADDVWFVNMFKLRRHSFTEAVNACRELHHPTIYNQPNDFLLAFIELDMSTDKKTKFFENFVDVVSVNHPYKHGEDRSILAFCKTIDQIDAALEAGASLAGSSDVITAVKRGKIVLPDFQFVIAHPAVMHELMVIRGLLRTKFPSLEKGTLSSDLPALINRFRIGIRYESKRDDVDPRYGWIDVRLGQLDTKTEYLEENLRLVLADVRKKGPRRTKDTEDYKFIRRCFLHTPLNSEKLLIPVEDYMEEEEILDSDDEDELAASP